MASPPPDSQFPSPQIPAAPDRPGIASVAADRGVAWWTESWRMFVAAPVVWIVMIMILCAIILAISFVPVLGQFASALVTPILIGGVLTGCAAQARGGEVTIGHAFACFSNDRLMPLFILGLLYVAATFLLWAVTVGLLVGVIGFGSIGALLTGDAVQAGTAMLATIGIGGLIVLLVTLLLLVPVMMAFWFAPALVALRGVEPLESLKQSFSSCIRNVGPFLIYGLVGLGFAVIATIPFGLGWFVLLPMSAISLYVGYRDIFGDSNTP